VLDKANPDNKDAANKKFQEIAFAYAILSDERRRKRYDTTGNTSESLDLDDDDFNWTDFFREQYAAVVTAEALDRIKKDYQGSDEEGEAMELAEELGVKEKLFGTNTKGKKSKKGGNDEAGLAALIQQRQKGRQENFFDNLEAKYAGGKKPKRRAVDEPPEEAFQKNAAIGKKKHRANKA
jgi:DnaJ homolog subfamily C member 9